MPFGSIKLIPGINTERTPTLLEAGYSASQLVRFKDGLAQKYGGWSKYYAFAVSGVPRDLHAWNNLNSTNCVLIGTTTRLGILVGGNFSDITPQQKTTNPAVNFSTTINSTTVTIVDAGISNVTVFDTIMLNTPVAIGGIVLSGPFQIQTIVGATSYNITSVVAATSTATNAGAVPVFTTTSGSSTVSVALTAHGLSVGSPVVFQVSTTGNGVTISGHATVATVTDANTFTINAANQATGSGSFSMNSGTAQIVYNIALGPPAAGSGYGSGAYGAGGYGLGTVGSAQTGTPITATDWTSDNWGALALACPSGGGVYVYDTVGGFVNAKLVATAPPFNGGIFVSTSLQMLFCWGSTQVNAAGQTPPVGVERDPMLVNWSNLGDYTLFTPSTTNQAGGFRIPIGSTIRTGMAVSNQNLFWTDLDLWAANYAGYPLVFGFNKIGAGAGAISSHAVQQLNRGIYWMGPSNFFRYAGSGAGVEPLPCPVWDAVFQNLNTTYTSNVRAMPNTDFNEVGWLYPSAASISGECDSYVKFNVSEQTNPWDYGTLTRSAWIDRTIVGPPLSAIPTGLIYQQETTRDADGAPMSCSFTTGYFMIAEGEDFAFVDQIIPDMKWSIYSGGSSAQVYLTFNVVDYLGDTPTQYGPYLMTSTTEYITVRIRGRQMSVTLASNDAGSFWRLGRIRYRWAPAGRR